MSDKESLTEFSVLTVIDHDYFESTSRGQNNNWKNIHMRTVGTPTHVGEALPEVAIDGVLVAVATEVADDALIEGLSGQEVPQHVQDAGPLRSHIQTSENINITLLRIINVDCPDYWNE